MPTEVTEHDRLAEALREPGDFRVEQVCEFLAFGEIGLRFRRRFRHRMDGSAL
nr:hypothetical protein [Gemmata sp. SH-PL17]